MSSQSTLDQRTGLRTDVQTSVRGKEDCPDEARNIRGLVVEGPFDGVGVPDVPHSLVGWIKDLGNPHVPGDDVHRGRED